MPLMYPYIIQVCGWFNLLGQVAVTTGISFACATFISTAATLGTSYEPSAKKVIGIYAAVLVAQGVLMLCKWEASRTNHLHAMKHAALINTFGGLISSSNSRFTGLNHLPIVIRRSSS
jgi:hypothetical protein